MLPKRFLLPLLLLAFHIAFAQKEKIDSLLAVLKTEKADTSRVKILNMLCGKYNLAGENEKAEEYGQKALALARSVQWKKGEAQACLGLGLTAGDRNDYARAMEFHRNSLRLYEQLGNTKYIAYCNINIGLVHSNMSEYKQALEFYFKALEAGRKVPDSSVVALCYNNIGLVYQNQSDYKKAGEYYLRSLQISRQMNDKAGLARLYNNLGIIRSEQGDYTSAIENYFLSLNYADSIGDKKAVALAFNNIGVVYKNQKEYKKALDFYNKSLEMYKAMGGDVGTARAFLNIGDIGLNQGDAKGALGRFQAALGIYSRIGDRQGMALAYNNIGIAYNMNDQADSAIACQERALAINRELSDEFNQAFTLNAIGEVLEKSKEYAKALEKFSEAHAISRNIGALERQYYSAQGLFHCYQAMGKTREALHWHEAMFAIKDSLFNTDRQKEQGRIESRFEYDKIIALQRAAREKEIEVQEEKEKRQQTIISTAGLVLLLVLVFSLIVVNRLRVTRRQKSIIESQKLLVEDKNREIISSISYAKRLQEAILPPLKDVKEQLPDSFVLYQPKDLVAGDFYWMENKEDILFIAAADCTGHGVPGAMVSVVCSNALNRAVKEFGITEPGRILDKVNELVEETFAKSESEVKDGMDISLCAIYRKTGKVLWAGANNPLWVVSGNSQLPTPNSQLTELKGDKQPIGRYSGNRKPFSTHEVAAGKGTSLYLFSDGFADQFGGPEGKKFKYKQLKKSILSIQDQPIYRQGEALQQLFERWKGSLEQVDDILVIGIKINLEVS